MAPDVCTRVPGWVLAHEDVSPKEVALSWSLWSFAGAPGAKVFPSQKAVEARSKLSVRSIRRGLLVLKAIGAVRDTGARKGRGVIVWELAHNHPLTPDTVTGLRDRGHGDRTKGPARPDEVTDQTGQGDRPDRPVCPTEETREENIEEIKEETTTGAGEAGEAEAQLSLVKPGKERRKTRRAIARDVLDWFATERQKVGKTIGREQTRRFGVTSDDVGKGEKLLKNLEARLGVEREEAAAQWSKLIELYSLASTYKDPKTFRFCTVANVTTWKNVDRWLGWALGRDNVEHIERTAKADKERIEREREDRKKAVEGSKQLFEGATKRQVESDDAFDGV